MMRIASSTSCSLNFGCLAAAHCATFDATSARVARQPRDATNSTDAATANTEKRAARERSGAFVADAAFRLASTAKIMHIASMNTGPAKDTIETRGTSLKL